MTSDHKSESRALRLLVLALGGVWLVCAALLYRMWSFQLEHHYGFAVFPLAAYLLLLRWENEVAASTLRSNGGAGWTAIALVGTGVLGVSSLLLEASPLWTAVGWLACGAAITASVGLVGGVGGGMGVRQALPPLLFTFTALPWPSIVLAPIVSALRSLNAHGAANLVSWAGRPALAHGAVIETGTAWVGVDQACSGIVGLQTAMMLALFFGELRALSRGRRLALLLGSIAIALLANLARTSWLTWQAATAGAQAVQSAHDLAGWVELGSVMVAVFLLSLSFRAGETTSQTTARPRLKISVGPSVAVLATLASLLLAVELWYRWPSPISPSGEPRWRMSAPSDEWRSAELAQGSRQMLRYDSATNITWHDAQSGRDWIGLLLNWDSDPALRYATVHTPEICLPAAGAELEANLAPAVVTVSGLKLEFRVARFRANGQTFHAFSCIWDASVGRSISPEANSVIGMTEGRIAMIREHRRQLGLEVITLVLNRCNSDEEAVAAVREIAPQLLRLEQ